MTTPNPPISMEQVREKHKDATSGDTVGWCRECTQRWPCDAIQLAERVERLEGIEAATAYNWRLCAEDNKQLRAQLATQREEIEELRNDNAAVIRQVVKVSKENAVLRLERVDSTGDYSAEAYKYQDQRDQIAAQLANLRSEQTAKLRGLLVNTLPLKAVNPAEQAELDAHQEGTRAGIHAVASALGVSLEGE